MLKVKCLMLNVKCSDNSTFNIEHLPFNIPPQWLSVSTYSSYSSAVISSSSTSLASAILMRTIQPSPYGSVLTSSGFSVRRSFTSTIVPPTGANNSETALTDSIDPSSSPASSSVPTCGSSTNTTSPSSFCA